MDNPTPVTSPHAIVRAAGLADSLSFFLGTAADLMAQEVAWARVDPAGQGQTFVPSTSLQYSTAGQTISVTRGTSDNEFLVKIPGAAPSPGGCIHASACSGSHTAVVETWLSAAGDVNTRIALYDRTGAPANDESFLVHWRHEGGSSRREAYVWANDPTAATYTPLTTWS